MIYILTFNCHGKAYTISQEFPGQFLPNQYEAVACGLLLGKIELEKDILSREDKYVDVCLVENDGNSMNTVWVSKEYTPISEEVK